MRDFLENNQVIFSSSEEVFEVAVGVFFEENERGRDRHGESVCVYEHTYTHTEEGGGRSYLFILNNHSSAFWMEASAN